MQIKLILIKPKYLANSRLLVDLVNNIVHYARDSKFQYRVV